MLCRPRLDEHRFDFFLSVSVGTLFESVPTVLSHSHQVATNLIELDPTGVVQRLTGTGNRVHDSEQVAVSPLVLNPLSQNLSRFLFVELPVGANRTDEILHGNLVAGVNLDTEEPLDSIRQQRQLSFDILSDIGSQPVKVNRATVNLGDTFAFGLSPDATVQADSPEDAGHL